MQHIDCPTLHVRCVQTEPWRFVELRRNGGSITEFNKIKMRVVEHTLRDDPAALEAFRAKMAKKGKNNAKIDAMLVICCAAVPNSKGKLMPEWEEIAAVSCAVQNMHLALTSHWSDGYGGYWTSGGAAQDGWMNSSEALGFLGFGTEEQKGQGKEGHGNEGQGNEGQRQDRVLGAFVLGACAAEKMNKYRAKRGDFRGKVGLSKEQRGNNKGAEVWSKGGELVW